MNNDLTVKNHDFLTTVTQTDLSDLIKPLVNEIHLFDTFVAGTSYLEDPSVLQEIAVGDKLTLLREANKFDDKAILIRTQDKRKLGYIPEKDNLIFSRLMDAGKLLTAKISSIDVKGSFHRIGIGVYLVDY
ncbi:MAG: HIRAN domain-containing protein [Mogibacterium sp.]|nr:HIRAN domain-containing protein [Mogibacterium sp.]